MENCVFLGPRFEPAVPAGGTRITRAANACNTAWQGRSSRGNYATRLHSSPWLRGNRVLAADHIARGGPPTESTAMLTVVGRTDFLKLFIFFSLRPRPHGLTKPSI